MSEDESIIKEAILRHHEKGAVFILYYIELAPDIFEKDQNHAKF